MPLVLGGVGGLVVIVAVVAALALSGGGDEPVHQGGNGQAQANPPAETGPSVSEKLDNLQRELLGASSTTALETVYRKAKGLGGAGVGTAKKAAERALTLDGTLDWAQLAIGNVKFDGSDLPDEDEVLYENDDYKVIKEARDKKWLTPDEAKALATAKTGFMEHFNRLKKDAHYRKIWHWRGVVAKHPVFANYKYKIVEARPYLLFIEDPGDEKKLAELEKKADQKAKIFTRLYEVFLETFQEPLGLKRLESDNYDDDVILKAWIFASRKSFDDYQSSIGQPVPPGVAAYYSPTDQWMIIPESEPDPTEEGFTTGAHFHEGTHQLIHYYTKWLVEKDTGEDLVWRDPRLDSDSHWFQEGIAELFGNVRKVGDSWELFQYSKGRMGTWKAIRRAKGREWKFKELLSASGNGDLNIPPGWMAPLFYSQAWAFTYFLWNYEENGKLKYHDKFMEYIKSEFHGKSGIEVFKKIFDLEKVEGSELEKEFNAYAADLVERGKIDPRLAAQLGIKPDDD